jgi:hypothetical protein
MPRSVSVSDVIAYVVNGRTSAWRICAHRIVRRRYLQVISAMENQIMTNIWRWLYLNTTDSMRPTSIAEKERSMMPVILEDVLKSTCRKRSLELFEISMES